MQMKQEVKTPLLVGIVVAVVAGAVFFGFRAMGNAGNLDQGQVKYTPGVPPWKETDPAKKGVGGLGSGGPGASAAPVQPGMPAGPPVVDNGK